MVASGSITVSTIYESSFAYLCDLDNGVISIKTPHSHAAQTRCEPRETEMAMVRYDPEGVKIVLTAPRGEMSAYNGDPFGAFVAVFPEKVIPRAILRPEWFKPEDNPDGSARFVPYGLRKGEALLRLPLAEEDVVVCPPD